MREIEIAFPVAERPDQETLRRACARTLRIAPEGITGCTLLRRSLDARGRSILYRYRMQIVLRGEPLPRPFEVEPYRPVSEAEPVIVIGAGPAGLFAALALLQQGRKPVILERGKDVHARKFDMARLTREQRVHPDSNYCFGEGGAGAFSDGKLYTRSNKRGDLREVLCQLVRFGANESILTDAHPHIGSDRLPRIIENIRNCILEHGGEVRFNTRVTDLFREEGGTWRVVCRAGVPDGRKTEIPDPNGTERTDGTARAERSGEEEKVVFRAREVILATGHSAREMYELFYAKGWKIEPKGFALGVRAEHPQALINRIQYHGKYRPEYPAAEYALVCQAEGKGVFSFCMCPGGMLIPAATSSGEIVLNGMSNSRRNSRWANAGIVAAVDPEDLPDEYEKYGPLRALRFQEEVERRLFRAGNGSLKAPAQRMDDFVHSRVSADLPETSYVPGAWSAPLHELLPEIVVRRLQKAFPEFDKKMRGYYTHEALLLAVESRTSSPVRIPRDSRTLEHPELPGLYPCGEGAGYAGGIVSSALDGINCARKIR